MSFKTLLFKTHVLNNSYYSNYTGPLQTSCISKCNALKKLLSKLSKSLTKSRYKKSCYFYQNESSQHFFKIVPLRHYSYTTSNAENIPFRKNISFQKLCYPFQLLSSETVLTMKCEMPEALVYLKTVS